MNKALLVGINEYPDKENILSACVNDVNDVAEFLVDRCDFEYDNVRLLTERRATRSEILRRLEWLVKGLQAGDRAVFLYSGHGNRVATRDLDGHVDRYSECICPFDFDWDGSNNITDSELCQLFARIPKGARLVWISDSCYSGGLSEPEAPVAPRRGKTFQLPLDMTWRMKSAERKSLRPMQMSGAVAESNVVLISATQERQQAQEKSFDGEIKVNGMLVYFLLAQLKRAGGLDTSLRELMDVVIADVKRYGEASRPSFRQEPALHGRPDLTGLPFLR